MFVFIHSISTIIIYLVSNHVLLERKNQFKFDVKCDRAHSFDEFDEIKFEK